jgi:7-cyano-7-deazaguanine synthase in queuosine biosynthesis
MIYYLEPTNTKFDTDVDMPFLEQGKKMGVFLSGGMESTLLVKLAQEKYGKDNVLCFYNDSIFCENNPDKKVYINSNIRNAEQNLNVSVIYLDLDYTFHVTNRKESVIRSLLDIENTYNVEFVLWGFTKLFFEVEPFKQNGLTTDDVYRIAYDDRERFKSTIEEFHLPTHGFTEVLLDIDIPPEVYPILRDSEGFIRSPFKHLNKSEVVDLYRQTNNLDILARTTSCIQPEFTKSGMHCGYCFNCQQRYDAFSILNNPNIKDPTKYACDYNVERRKKLLEVTNGIH